MRKHYRLLLFPKSEEKSDEEFVCFLLTDEKKTLSIRMQAQTTTADDANARV